MKALVSWAIASILLVYGERQPRTANNYNKKVNNIPMENTYPVKNINVSINKPAADVYRFASNPENFPKWVEFVRSVKKDGDYWIGETTLGQLRIKFTPANDFGIIDHHVTLPDGKTVYNPMRVLDNNEGCEFIFTLFRMPGRTDKEYNDDARSLYGDRKSVV